VAGITCASAARRVVAARTGKASRPPVPGGRIDATRSAYPAGVRPAAGRSERLRQPGLSKDRIGGEATLDPARDREVPPGNRADQIGCLPVVLTLRQPAAVSSFSRSWSNVAGIQAAESMSSVVVRLRRTGQVCGTLLSSSSSGTTARRSAISSSKVPASATRPGMSSLVAT
jgi:hypothetical protein